LTVHRFNEQQTNQATVIEFIVAFLWI